MAQWKQRETSLPAASDAINQGMVRRPLRSVSAEIIDFLTSRDVVMVSLLMSVALMLVFPMIWMIAIPFTFLYYAIVASRKYRLPFKMPMTWGGRDYGAPKPAGRGYGNSSGILAFGNDDQTGEQLWVENDDARRHGFFLGTTGSGKALPMDALVLTTRGWVYNRDIRPGDMLVHPDGTQVEVHSIHPQGSIPAVRLWFADGRTALCSMDHLWQVRIRPNGGMMPKGLEEKDEIRTAGDIGILKGVQGENLRISIPLLTPASMERSLKVGEIDFMRLAQEGFGFLDFMPSTCGTPDERFDFLRHWAAARGPAVTRTPGALKLHRLQAAEARAVKHLVWSLGGTATTILRKAGEIDGEMDLLVNFRGMDRIWHLGATIEPVADLEIIRVDRVEEDLEMSCLKTGREDGLYVMEEHLVTHNTELLLGVVSQTLMWSSGFLFIDGKGTIEFYARVWTMARRFGREDDVRVLNFTDSGGDPDAPAGGPDVQSNTINPFAKGGPDQLMNVVVSLMGDAGQQNDMWKNRAMSLVTAEMKALCELRDAGEILLNVQTIRDFLFLGKGLNKDTLKACGITKVTSETINKVPEKVWEEMRGRAGLIELYLRSINRDFSEATYLALKGFFDTLPGFSLDKALNGDPQDAKCLEQYGFLSMQLTKPLGSLADDYGHIFRTPLGEVDIDDVVLNRRIMVVLLPALQKAPEEMQNCGKIIVTLVKIMMGNASGFMIQGSKREIVDSKQTRAPSPFVCVMDEAGYYMVAGVDVMMAQARSLGFMIIVAGQDMAAMQKTSPQIAETAIANASIFAAGKTVDGDKTLKFIQSVFGRAHVSVTQGYQKQNGLLFNRWVDRMDASIQEADRVRIEELQNMMPGEFYFLFNGTLVRAATFYVGEDFSDQFSVNKFLKVRGPTDQVPGLDQSREIAFLKEYLDGATAIASYTRKDLPDQNLDDDLVGIVARARATDWSLLAGTPDDARARLLAWRDAAFAEIGATEEGSHPDLEIDDIPGWMPENDVEGLMDFENTSGEDLLDELAIQDSRRKLPGEDLVEGIGRVVHADSPDERSGGMIDILVAQNNARDEARKSPVVDRYLEDAKSRVQSEERERLKTVHDFFSQVAEQSHRFSRLFAEDGAKSQAALEILKRSSGVDTVPLSVLNDGSKFEGVVSTLEKFIMEGGD